MFLEAMQDIGSPDSLPPTPKTGSVELRVSAIGPCGSRPTYQSVTLRDDITILDLLRGLYFMTGCVLLCDRSGSVLDVLIDVLIFM